jgi:AbrB family looped-hinge helix DNA binding protein
MKSTVSEKGQVTIPKAVRDRLGLRPGQVLEFEARGGLLVGRKRAGESRAVDRLFGILGPLDVDAELTKSRGKAWNRAQDAPRAHRR